MSLILTIEINIVGIPNRVAYLNSDGKLVQMPMFKDCVISVE